MADQEIEGLPEGATVRPISQSQSMDIEGLPEGATVRPLTSPVASTEKSFSERHPIVSAVGSALLGKPTGGQEGQEGMLTSFGHGMGIPTSVEEAKEAAPKLSLGGAVEAVGGPAAQAGKMIYGAAQQGYKGRKEAAQEIKEAGSNILSGQPILPNIGKAGYGLAHGILQSIPFAGPLTEKAGEQIAAGNIPGAIGSGAAATIQSLGFLKGSEAKPVDPVALEHLKILEDRLKTAQTEAVKPKKIYDAHQAVRDEGGAAPKKVVEDHEEAQANVRAAEESLAAHKRAMVAPPVPADREITPAEVEAARPETPTPTDEELKARQNRLMGSIEERLGMGKYAPVEPKAEPEVSPAVTKPEPLPIMTAGEPERAPDMRGLKVTPEGKVIDTTAAESAAREALGVESPGRQVPATKGIAMRPPYAKEEPAPTEHKIELRKTPVAEIPKVEVPKTTEIPKTEPGLLGTEKELLHEGRSPEDLTELDRVLFQLTNQEQLRLGTEHGVNEAEHDLSKKTKDAHRLPVGKQAHVEATKAAMPEALKNHIIDAAHDWDNKNPQVFDPAAMNSQHGADRSRAILKEAQRRYAEGDQVTINASGESDVSQENLNRMESQKNKGIKTFRVKPSGERVPVLPADAADAHANRGEHTIEVDKDGNETIKDSGPGAPPLRPAKGYGEANVGVSKDAKDAAVKSLKDKMTRSSAGFDPTMLADAAKIGTYHLEAGARAFADWSGKMVDELGEAIKPHLEELWNKAAVAVGGGEYQGIQEGAGKVKDQVLFGHPETKSTLTLPAGEVTPDAVRAKLESHKTEWDKASGEATDEALEKTFKDLAKAKPYSGKSKMKY